MQNLDRQLHYFKDRLQADVGIDIKLAPIVCTTIYEELQRLPSEGLLKVKFASPVALEKRIEELTAFNMMMNTVNSQFGNHPEIVRSQVIVQNYMSFVYLKDGCFEVAKKLMPTGTTLKRVCKFLLNNPVQAFRNSIAHGNWQYLDDFSGLKYFAHKGESKPDGDVNEMSEFTVDNDELNFWQTLARATAYTIYTFIVDNTQKN